MKFNVELGTATLLALVSWSAPGHATLVKTVIAGNAAVPSARATETKAGAKTLTRFTPELDPAPLEGAQKAGMLELLNGLNPAQQATILSWMEAAGDRFETKDKDKDLAILARATGLSSEALAQRIDNYWDAVNVARYKQLFQP